MKKKYKVLLFILVLLIAVRIYLPFWVKDYVNTALDNVPGYTGSIEGVNLQLYRGAYQIEKLKMTEITGEVPVPFLDIELIDLSVQWNALFKGRVVGEIVLTKPIVNIVMAKNEGAPEQTGSGADWTQPIKDLMPLQVNRLTTKNGQFNFKDYSTDPEIDLFFNDLNLEALNLSNAEGDTLRLPSDIKATAMSIGGGEFNLSGKANILKEVPDFDIEAKLEGVDLTALNSFADAYAKLDFEKGQFSLYSEMAVADGQMTGYVKPIMTDFEVFDLSEEHNGPLRFVWEAIGGTIISLLQNHPKDQFATKIPLEGDLNSPETKVWPTVGNIFKNAFIKAFLGETDDSVSFEDLKK